ncbi:glycosyltransferase family 2 protein [Psychrobacter sp. I-STPA10]|uniref:glycosyltransferase family 2 protein n=1 Tax=Psychrobacter sp. I-STPA10 TaxID=2585769 RepID=UPI001E31789F|nr:glycosyltransferase family 2 protein [Psychrobacter sp. I-STPA10]
MKVVHEITVIIPNYNRDETLIKALASVLLQTESVKKIIVVDDCSDVEIFEKVKSKIDTLNSLDYDIEIELVRMAENSGANVCRNYGINMVDTKYIAFLDSDDIWTQNKVKTQMEHIYRGSYQETRPILSCTGRVRVDAEYSIIAQQFSGRELIYDKLLTSNYLGTLSSVVVETWIARFIGGFDQSLPACQDWDFFIRVSRYIKYVGVSEPLCIYVDHDEERITSSNKNRIYGHLKIRSKYLKNNLSYSEYTEFFRNIAEDFSELGDKRNAIKYYMHSQLSKENNMILRVVKYPSILRYATKNWKLIKSFRYIKYREKPVKINIDEYNSLISNINIIEESL